MSTPKYLKMKGTSDGHPYHVWTPLLAARGDMEPFTPREEQHGHVSMLDEEPEPAIFRAKSCGFGRFRVVNGSDEPVSDAMTKSEAETLAEQKNKEAQIGA